MTSASAGRTVILVSGGGSNLQAIIDAAASGHIPTRIVGVISDRPGVHALERAARAGIPATVVDFSEHDDRRGFSAQIAQALDAHRADLVVLAGFMRILDPGLVERYSGRMLNVHPSLLPKYPGLHTYRRALDAGDREHGSTVHFVIPELDAGPAIIQYRLRIGAGDTEEGLRARVQRGEHVIYPRAIGWVAAGRAVLEGGRTWLDGKALPGPVVVDEQQEASVAVSPLPP